MRKNGGLRIEVSNILFAQNEARGFLGSGGGMRIQGRGVSAAIYDSVSFALNKAHLDGGGMHISNEAFAYILNASFVGNEALNGGGAALYILVRPSWEAYRCSHANCVTVAGTRSGDNNGGHGLQHGLFIQQRTL